MPAVFLVSFSKDLGAWANYSNLTLCKICQNTSFLRHVFSCIRTKSTTLLLYGKISLSEKCPYSEFFWSEFSPNVGKYGPEKINEYGHFSRSVWVREKQYSGIFYAV